MRRRAFIAGLGAAAVAAPLEARAQQPTIPIIGFLSGRSRAEIGPALAEFHRGLGDLGFVEGKNVAIDYQWAEGRYDRLPGLAAALVERPLMVIAATGGNTAALAAKAATSAIPIVFTLGGDPVTMGLVSSLNQPGGNATGVTLFIAALVAAARLEPNGGEGQSAQPRDEHAAACLVVGDREACALRQQQYVEPVLRHVVSTEALLYHPRVPS